MMVAASFGGLGFTITPTAVSDEALKHYGLKVIAEVEECGNDYYAITAERRVKHPVAAGITSTLTRNSSSECLRFARENAEKK
jgi:LysR family transcriptional activator of nhaA